MIFNKESVAVQMAKSKRSQSKSSRANSKSAVVSCDAQTGFEGISNHSSSENFDVDKARLLSSNPLQQQTVDSNHVSGL